MRGERKASIRDGFEVATYVFSVVKNILGFNILVCTNETAKSYYSIIHEQDSLYKPSCFT